MEPEVHEDEMTARQWSSSLRLAMTFSVVAALAAVLLAGHLPETTIVVTIIVVGTMLSWLQLEERPAAVPVRQRRSTRPR